MKKTRQELGSFCGQFEIGIKNPSPNCGESCGRKSYKKSSKKYKTLSKPEKDPYYKKLQRRLVNLVLNPKQISEVLLAISVEKKVIL